MSGIDGWGEAAQRAAEEARWLAEARLSEERASQLAQSLAQSLAPTNARAPEETARLLAEVARLPLDLRAKFVAASALPSATAPPTTGPTLLHTAAALRDRLVSAFPEGSDGRLRLGAALVRLGGGEPGVLARSVLEAKAAKAFTGLVSLVGEIPAAPSPVRPEAPEDRLERSQSHGPFASSLPPSAPLSPSRSPETTVEAAVIRPAAGGAARLEGGRSEPLLTHRADSYGRDALTAAFGEHLRSTAAPATPIVAATSIGPATPIATSPVPPHITPASSPAFVPLRVENPHWESTARGLLAPTVASLAERLPNVALGVARAREAMWSRYEPNPRVAYGMDRANAHLSSVLETAGSLVAAAPSSLAVAKRKSVFEELAAAREGLLRVRDEARGAVSELEQVARIAHGSGVRTALKEIHGLEREAQGAESELRFAGGRAAVLDASEEPAFGPVPEPAVADASGSGAADFTEEDLARLGSGLDPSKPPAQTLWNENQINLVCEEGRKQGGVTDAEGAQHAELARLALDPEGQLGGGAPPHELTPVDLAAVLNRSGLALERIDPNQVVAATRYLNTATTRSDQQEKLRKVLDNFQVLDRIGLPRMSPEQLMGQLDTYAKVPGKATAKLSDQELRAKFNEVALALNGGGEVQTKIGSYNLKLSVNDQGQVTSSSCKKPGLFSRIGSFVGKVAPFVLTALSFTPLAPYARMVQAVLSGIQAARRGSVLGLVTSAANLVAGGAMKFAGKVTEGTANIFNTIQNVADSVAKGLHGYSALRRGSFVSGLANIGAAVAGGVKSVAGGASSRLLGLANALDRIADPMLKAGTVIDAGQSFRNANKALGDAKRALQQAEARGNPEEIAAARRNVELAEREKTASLLGGLGSVAMVAADHYGNRKTPGLGDPAARAAAGGREAIFRVVSRGLSGAGDVVRRNWEGAAVNGLGVAAAVQGGLSQRPAGAGDPTAERLDQMLGPGPRVSWLNDLSNVTDAAHGYRQADKGVSNLDEVVEGAEQALQAARRQGDPDLVREAEAALSLARRDREGALMGAIASADGMVQTPGVIQEQHRQAEDFAEARDRALRVARDFDDLIASAARIASRTGPGTEAGEKAAAEWNALRQAQASFEEGLRLGGGDPAKTRALAAAFRAEQIQAATRIQDLDAIAPPVRYADGPQGVVDPYELRLAAFEPEEVRNVREESRKHLKIDERILEDVLGELSQAPTDHEGFSHEDPELRRAATELKKAIDDLKVLNDDGAASDEAILAARLRLNVARAQVTEARKPSSVREDPLLVGIGTFVEEFGKGALGVLSLGGAHGIEKALQEERLDARSGFVDFVGAYLEGIRSGVTLGGADEYLKARGQGTDAMNALVAGVLRFGQSALAVDEFRILNDPTRSVGEKSAAVASMVSKYAGLAAGGVAVRQRLAGTSGAPPPGKLEPKSGGPASSGGSGSKPEVLAGSKLEHQNASIAEIHGYRRAQARGEIGILEPGATTAPGRPDYITLDLNKREIVVYDSKYRGPGGKYPSGVPTSKLQSWLPQVRKAIEAMPNGPVKTRALQALQQGKIRGEVFKWPQ